MGTESMLVFLIALPLVAALLVFIVRHNRARNIIVCAASAIIAVASIYLVITGVMSGGGFYAASSEIVDFIALLISCILVCVILVFGIRYRNPLAIILAIVQLALVLIFDIGFSHNVQVTNGLYIDNLSLIMTFIIGVIGSGICVYALGYMKDFQEHEPEDAKDRRPMFFAIMFIFLSAMFVIVFSDNMSWLFIGWEVTTVCSFLLIGYTRTEEAIKNAFRQIIMNLLGGIAFIVGLILCVTQLGTLSLNMLLTYGLHQLGISQVILVLLAFAAITKAAQMPFQSWLLGAMVAPTPTSALLHSSTMVKAGVFLLLKLAPAFSVNIAPSIMVMLVGAVTFLLCSFMAISQSNAKRVLAYSTIANLGLITACAGVGTAEAIWAGCFLMLFHAIAKSLLFLCVGTAEHHIGSRNIEDMDLLFERMPRLARLMMLGIMCMFIAPFGMLIAKWGTLVSFVDVHQIALIIILAFGSAATFMFWAKWLGKLSGIAGQPENVEISVHKSEWTALGVMACLLVAACVLLPLISTYVVEPYIASISIGSVPVYSLISQSISSDNLWIGSICVVVVVIVLFAGLGRSRQRKVDVYLSGVGRDNDRRMFQNSLSTESEATVRNWYMDDVFGERRIGPVGVIFNTVIVVAAFLFVVITAVPGVL